MKAGHIRTNRKSTHGNATHGLSNSRTFAIWTNMISRCSAKNGSGWKTYGSRGIKVCDRWLRFEDFLADMGLAPPGLEIDRKDNDGDYEPSNCRWATRAEQMSNRSNHKLITAFGETLNIAEWARRTGLKYRTIHRRIHAGWAGEKALSTAGCEVTNA